jgi:hypothetical protein
MPTHGPIAWLLVLGAFASPAEAGQFTVTDVSSIASAGEIKPHDIAFAELDHDEATNPVGLIPFEDWAQTKPDQKKFLSPFPDYVEPTVVKPIDGVEKTITEKLLVYVAEARFAVARPSQSIYLARYATTDFLSRLDRAIEHRQISAAEVDNDSNKNPTRQWCGADKKVACVRSTYRLEGKLPIAVQLVNQLTDQRKLDDFLEFQSELGVLTPPDLDQAGLARLTGIDAPIAGAIEQTIFHINQVMQFGKFLAVLQADPADANRTVVTAFIALALKARPLESSKKYQNVPVLRNLVPSMVLAGKSSFNAGRSISGGLPLFARNNVKAVAAIFDETEELCALQFSLLKVHAVRPKSCPEALMLVIYGADPTRSCKPETEFLASATSCGCRNSLLQACAKHCARRDARRAEAAFPGFWGSECDSAPPTRS